MCPGVCICQGQGCAPGHRAPAVHTEAFMMKQCPWGSAGAPSSIPGLPARETRPTFHQPLLSFRATSQPPLAPWAPRGTGLRSTRGGLRLCAFILPTARLSPQPTLYPQVAHTHSGHFQGCGGIRRARGRVGRRAWCRDLRAQPHAVELLPHRSPFPLPLASQGAPSSLARPPPGRGPLPCQGFPIGGGFAGVSPG